METLIGFVIGYLVGTGHGADGVRRTRAAVQAIGASPTVRQAVATGVVIARSAARQAGSGGAAEVVGIALDAVSRRASGSHAAPRSA